MGEKEEITEYSPEELEEIERIKNHISSEISGGEIELAEETPSVEMPSAELPSMQESSEEEIRMPEEDMEEEFTMPETGQDEFAPAGDESLEFPDISDLEGPGDELQDITDIVQEIEEPEASFEEVPEEIAAGDLDLSFPGETGAGAEAGIDEADRELFESIPDEAEVLPQEPEEAEPVSGPSMDEFDLGMPDEAFAGVEDIEDLGISEEEAAAPEPEEDFIGIEEGELEPLTDEQASGIPDISMPDTGGGETEGLEGIEGIEDIGIEAMPEESSPEAGPGEADLGIEEIFSPETAEPEAGGQEEEELPVIDIEGLDEHMGEAETPAAEAGASDQDSEFSIDFEALHEEAQQDEKHEDLISVSAEAGGPEHAGAPGEGGVELSDSELRKLKKVIQFFHPKLTQIIKDVILQDLLRERDIKQLVRMLLDGVSEAEIKDYLERKLDRKIDTPVETERRKRRVIAARPEYTREGRERQARLLKATKIFGVAALATFIATIFSYQYLYKPYMAKRKIDEGIQLIKRPGVPVLQKQADYKKAEDIFRFVDENYAKDYIHGYLAYGRAYTHNKEYDYALLKFNKAYDIDSSNLDVLNNLGNFYSKLSDSKFEQIKPNLGKYYYDKIRPVVPINRQVDVAIDFYKKALNVDPRNIDALYGIGNAYSNQGEFRKAREYYENILAVDKNSIVGYSGLLNLYIDRDAFPEVLSVYSDILYSKNMTNVPSALLAKLAAYFLSKKRTNSSNIRIDYGIQSPVIKDFSDNPHPAVKTVLDALAARDIDYPPLFLLFAKLSEQQGNLNLMKRNLQTALEKEPDYFAANLMLARYHYLANEPVEAYRFAKKAQESYLSPPEFTTEDFYYETENIGQSYAIMGNIFYYFFDEVKFRFGDEFEDEGLKEDSEKFANIEIAQDKYEKALAENYKTSEIYYNLGRIYYIKGQYDKAASTWLKLYEDFIALPELMFALGNAFYHQNNLEASKGEYLKVISLFEDKEEKIKKVVPGRTEHTRIYQTLASAYNNLGAVYQVQNMETKSNISYWKSIDYAKRIDRENEFARVNLARAFKPGRENVMPVLDESIPVGIDVYKESLQ